MENPYTSRNMIKQTADFFGRKSEVDEIFSNLRHMQSTSLVGERRIGKSSLLWHISQPEIYKQFSTERGKPFRIVFFDLQKVASLNQKSFFRLLFTNLAEQFQENSEPSSSNVESWQDRFDELVDQAYPNFSIVICLDEFETVTTNLEFDNAFLVYLRHFANLGKVAYITSSREPLEEICRNTDHIQGSDFWNIFVSPPLYLEMLKKEEALELVNLPSEKAGISFEKSEVDFIFEMAGYHPLFLQIACFCLFDVKKRKHEANQPVGLDSAERNQVFESFLSGASPHFKHIWSRLSSAEQNLVASCETIDRQGEMKEAIRALTKKGILISGNGLKPFSRPFELFAKENLSPDRRAMPKGPPEPEAEVPKRAYSPREADYGRVFSFPETQEPASKRGKLDVWMGRKGELLLDFSGPYTLSKFCSNCAKVDQTSLARFCARVRNLPQHEDWRLEKQEIGQSVQEIFEPTPELAQIYSGGKNAIEDDERLLLTFRCSHEMLAFPFEFINSLSDIEETQRHIVLTHPMRKSIVGIQSRKMPLSAGFHLEARAKILLASSNVSGNTKVSGKNYFLPEIPAADAEIEALERLFAERRAKGEVQCVVDVRRDVTCEEMAELLERGEYDAVHYAGHGFHSDAPEESCLFFWEEPKGKQVQNVIRSLSANELNNLVGRSRTKFVYLSCCQGAEVGSPVQLLNNDFLGIAHSLLLGGIPSVLSMRWPLTDDMAILLAVSFYKELLNGHGFETALLRARRQVQSRRPTDFNWLSPVLVVQGD